MPKSKHRKKKAAAASVPATAASAPQRNILFAIPTYSGDIHVNTMTAIANASVEAAAQGWRTDMTVRSLDSIISRARYDLFSIFLAKPEATDLFFVDADVAWHPGAFTRLMSHDVDLVGGVYPSRGDPTGPHAQDFVIKPHPGELFIQPNGLIDVEGVGTGFMRVTRKCAERMVEVNNNRWFYDRTAQGLKIYSLFEFELDIVGRQMFSEDYVFCRRWRETGGKVWADAELTLLHTGEKTFAGHFGNYLRTQHKAAMLQQYPATLGPARIADMTKEALAEMGIK